MTDAADQETRILGAGASVALGGALAGSGLTYLTGLVVSRLVGAELLGVYFLAIIWLTLGSTIGRLGLSDALLRFVPPARLHRDHTGANLAIKTAVCLGGGSGVVLAGVFSILLVWLRAGSSDRLVASYLAWFLWALPLHVIFTLLLMVIQAHQWMGRVAAIRDLLQPLLLIGLTAALVPVAGPRIGLVGGFALSLALAIPLALVSVHRIAPGAFTTPGWAPVRPMLLFSLPVMLSDASSYAYRWLDTLVIGRLLTLRDVGIYNAASRTALLVSLVLTGANAIYASVAAGYFNTARVDRLERALHAAMRWCLLLALPLVLFLVVGGDWILSLWGREFSEAAPALVILAGAHLVGIPAGLFAYTLVMCNRERVELLNTLVLMALLLATSLLLIPLVGFTGAAAALFLVNTLALLARGYQVRRLLGVQPFAASLLKPIGVALLALVAVSAVRSRIPLLLPAAGPAPSVADAPALLASLAVLGSMVAIAFFGPCLLVDAQGRELVRVSLLRLLRPGRAAAE
jgi:O-antigen/teichoic acid export membrane protein